MTPNVIILAACEREGAAVWPLALLLGPAAAGARRLAARRPAAAVAYVAHVEPPERVGAAAGGCDGWRALLRVLATSSDPRGGAAAALATALATLADAAPPPALRALLAPLADCIPLDARRGAMRRAEGAAAQRALRRDVANLALGEASGS